LQVVQDADVRLQVQEANSSPSTELVRASNADSENKLLQTAEVELPSEGKWTLRIRVAHDRTTGDIAIPLLVVKPNNSFTIRWSYVIFTTFSVILMLTWWRRHSGSKSIRPRTATIATANDPGAANLS
jgi:hypothetical protein